MIPGPDPSRQCRRTGPQPDDEVAGEGGAHARIEHDAPGGCQYRGRVVAQDSQHGLRFEVAVGSFAALLPERPDGLARLLGDDDVDVDERPCRSARRPARRRWTCRTPSVRRAPRASSIDPESPTGEVEGQVLRGVRGVLLRHSVLRHQLGQVAGIEPPGHVVAGRDAQQGPGVVVEADGVGESGRLDDRAVEAADAFGAVEEPPRRPKAQCGIVPGQRRQLAAVGRLVEGVDDRRSAPARCRTGRAAV